MNLIILLSLSTAILIIAYFTYGKFVARKLQLDNKNISPSKRLNDGVDYVPSDTPVVLGHHFASIAGAGPIIGPIIAVAFGWIPAVIWILVGGVFFGAVHDFTSLVASMRHDGKSIGSIIQKYIGKNGKRLFLIFSFATLILIIAVFADIIGKTFVNDPGVASASILFIGLAIAFGITNKLIGNSKIAFIIISVIGVALMYYFVFLGMQFPFALNYKIWVILLLLYAFVAAVAPVSFLLQPRDYLTSFLLYGLIIFAVIGVVIANPEIKMDNEVHFQSESLGYIFPVLFVTVACGAISGFHSLVASGTTSKQIKEEKNSKLVGYGGMLIESFLAILSVGAVIIISRTDYSTNLLAKGPVTMFADGLGGIISSTGISVTMATSFVALTISAFALTTLDTCTRLARYSFQEYMEDVNVKRFKKLIGNRYVATFTVVVFTILLLFSGEFAALWPIFGSANQLLAALALLTVAVWLTKRNVNPTFVLIPMFFMFAVSLCSLFIFAVDNFEKNIYVLSVMAGILFVLSLVLIWLARKSLKKKPKQEIVMAEEALITEKD